MNAITEKLVRSWQLFTRSMLVLRQHPKLLVFPIVTGVLTLAIAVFFLAPVVAMLLAPQWIHGGLVHTLADRLGFVRVRQGTAFNFQLQPLAAVFFGAIYLLNMFLATMSSVAFNSEIMEALGGRGVSISHGLEVACRRWKSVLFWSLLAVAVGLVIRAIEGRVAFVGRLVAGWIGLAWSVASIFAIPVLVRESSTSNPFEVLMKSARTIKATWGEMLTGYVGLQGTNLLYLWGSILFWGIMGTMALFFKNAWILLLGGVPWLLCLVAYAYVSSIASRVYLCALYLYAAEGTPPAPYEASMMDHAWKTAKR